MKILQFEPLLWKDIVDYPDLGVAMLMGAYKQAGLNAVLAVTQLECIEYLFGNGAQKCQSLFEGLDETQKTEYPTLSSLKADFAGALDHLYQRYYQHTWESYFDSDLAQIFKDTFTELIRLNFLFLEFQGESPPLMDYFIKRISQEKYNAICISLYEYDSRNCLLLKRIHELSPATVILGGAFSGHMVESDVEVLRQEGVADYLSIGPGEESLVALIKELETANPDIHIPNIISLTDHSQYQFDRRPIKDLNPLIPDFSQSKADRYASPVTILPVQSARGCTWRKCTFCSHHRGYFGEYHTVNVENFVDILVDLQAKHHCSCFILHDDDIPALRLLNIGKEIRRRNLTMYLYSYVRADDIFLTPGLFEELYACGIRGLSWGIESGSQSVLDQINKGICINHAAEILQLSSRAGISNTCWMIINLPFENEDDFQKSISFMTNTAESVHLWLVSPFRPQYDSSIYEELKQLQCERTPLAYSAPISKEMQNNEEHKTRRINDLFGMNMFRNPYIPEKIIPVNCQRSRLIPFSFVLQYDTIPERGTFGLYPLCIERKLGNQLFLICNSKRRKLSEQERICWNKLRLSKTLDSQTIDEESRDFLETLIKEGLVYILPNDKFC